MNGRVDRRRVRICWGHPWPQRSIDDRFGTMEAQLIMAMIPQRYRIQFVPGAVVTPKPTITLRPADGIWVNLRRR